MFFQAQNILPSESCPQIKVKMNWKDKKQQKVKKKIII